MQKHVQFYSMTDIIFQIARFIYWTILVNNWGNMWYEKLIGKYYSDW